MDTKIHAGTRDLAISRSLGRLIMLFTLASLLTGCFWEGSDNRKLKIVTEPADATVIVGATASFTVQVNGGKTSFQWRRNGVDIAGATAATYTTPATVAGDNGATYSVVVSRGSRTLTSRSATLTVNVPPTITAQPADVTVAPGVTATFSVAAAGTAPLSYQWRRGGTNIAGATAATYTTPITVAGDNGAVFSVVVTNAAGTVTSSNATLTVASPPALTGEWGPAQSLDPADQRVWDESLAVSRETGDAVTVWVQSSDGVNRSAVFARLYDSATNAWSSPQLLTTVDQANDEFVSGPRAAINSSGDIVVTWNNNVNPSFGSTSGTVRAMRFKPGTGWSEEYTLTRLPGGAEPDITWTTDVDVAMDFAGNATVVWTEEYRSLGFVALAASARMPATGGFQTAQLLESTLNAQESSEIRVVMDDAGNATAIWLREKPNSSGDVVVTQRRLAGASGWGDETILVSLTPGGHLDYPRLAVNPMSGDVLAAWRQEPADASVTDIGYATFRASNSSWRTAALAETSTDEAGAVEVAVNKLGQGVLAWEVYGGSTDVIRAARIDMASGVLGSEFTIATNSYLPLVGVDMAGNIMAMYNDGLVWARRFGIDGSIMTPVRLSDTSVVTGSSGLGVTDDGAAVAMWTQGYLTGFGSIYVRADAYARVFR